MAIGTKLSGFEEGEITALKRVRKSQREIPKVLGGRKTVICYYLKSPNKYWIRKQNGRPEKSLPQFKRRIVRKIKKTTSLTSRNYIQQFCANTGCSLEDLPRVMDNRDGWLESQRDLCSQHDVMMMTCLNKNKTSWPACEPSNRKFVEIDCCKS